jgi:hypothetical protein
MSAIAETWRTYGRNPRFVETQDGRHVAEAASGEFARLIAAAPDLLAVLVEIADLTKRRQLPLTEAINDLAATAIAKATGQ